MSRHCGCIPHAVWASEVILVTSNFASTWPLTAFPCLLQEEQGLARKKLACRGGRMPGDKVTSDYLSRNAVEERPKSWQSVGKKASPWHLFTDKPKVLPAASSAGGGQTKALQLQGQHFRPHRADTALSTSRLFPHQIQSQVSNK